ncbi:lectin BRA-3-like [Trichomycterus rosablanca]|uniref:lectin BRA-3-like n=1 Tax=Trichomycterus rosablanca TaxID=2290929 RepID=UPI002F34FBA9
MFYCYRSWNLVTEKKTWLEALEYCKTNHTNLASPATEEQLRLAEKVASQAETVSVWTGLQFLDGQWFWISGETLGTSDTLPSCPAYDRRCGARNLKTKTWENRDCNEKLNFICY